MKPLAPTTDYRLPTTVNRLSTSNPIRALVLILCTMLISLLLSPPLLFSQNPNPNNTSKQFFYSYSHKIKISPVNNKVVIKFNKEVTLTQVNSWLQSSVYHTCKRIDNSTYSLSSDNIQFFTQKLKNNPSIHSVNLYYVTEGGSEMGVTDEFLVNFLPTATQEQINNINKTYGVTIIKTTVSYVLLRVPPHANTLEIANVYQESGLVKFSHPNFLVKAEKLEYIPNDEYFNNQWYLHNTGQTINEGHTGTPGADVSAPEAWEITKGSPNVVIAVIDEGVTSNHPDLPNTRQVRLMGSNFASDYDSTNKDDPSPTQNNNHGNACAGIIAATQDNNEGISGIAPLCKIMPIRVPLEFQQGKLSDYADAIDFAWKKGADVISISWSIPTNDPKVFFEVITNAIEGATTNGRNGKGTVVVIAAGNSANHASGDNGVVEFPANVIIPSVITVGASDRYDMQANYSPTSNPGFTTIGKDNIPINQTIDLVAPSHKSFSCFITGESKEIWSIDIPGNSGYNPWPNLFGDCEEFMGGNIPDYLEELPASGTNYLSYTARMGGTSAAAPLVAGIAGLVISVNPNITADKVLNLLQITADKVGGYNYTLGGTLSNEMGAGRVNAYQAVLNANPIDLYIRDTPNDAGLEPNNNSSNFYLSQDIWVRNQDDGNNDQTHQNPEYSSTNDPSQLNYIYVRVKNRGTQPYTNIGKGVLQLSWAKANISLSPRDFKGVNYFDPPANTVLKGDNIEQQEIPDIPAGDEIIMTFTWNPPDPYLYKDIAEAGDQWHFCLLASIVYPTVDPHTYYLGNTLWLNVKNNNNIAWKNLTVIDGVAGLQCIKDEVDYPDALMKSIGVTVGVGNPDNQSAKYDIIFSVPQEEVGNPVTKEGNVVVALDEKLYEKWVQGGKKGDGFNEVLSPPMSFMGKTNNQINANSPIVISGRKAFEITGTTTHFKNIMLEPQEIHTTALMVLYPADPISGKNEFLYDITQRRTEDGEFIGAVQYKMNKPVGCGNKITVGGGDRTINRGCTTTLIPTPQLQCVVYYWLDENGNLITTKSILTISPNKTTTYTLMTVSSEGCMSEDKATVYVSNTLCLREREIIKITPNPAQERVTVEYKVKSTDTAKLRLLKTDNSIDRTYPLDVNTNQIELNISAYTKGSYTLTLECDDINEDRKTLIIQ